ncbi:DEAD/DEAH box helicase [Myxococcus sp. AB025B]|uniref:DEAD/DEAH box helicase n=1 Tax=Myxococcus sp. AB025B TaxID=2562794 RepID=UPI00114462B3|nr:AAA domain-containing protein [Myxococcus sp. AB025B]
MNIAPHLARTLLEGRQGHAFRSEAIPYEVVDTLVTVRMERTTMLCLPGGDVREIQPVSALDLRRILDACPHAVWVCGFSVKEQSGSLLPFAPPRTLPLSARIPFRIPAWLAERAGQLGLRSGQDALERLSLDVGGRRIAVIGQRSIAALSDDDARAVTWWLPTGEVIETQLVTQDGQAWFELRQCIAARDAATARCGPNGLVRIEPGAGLPVSGEEAAGVAVADAVAFMSERSPLFDTWARYAQLSRERAQEKQQARAAVPLQYEGASQRGSTWVARARLNDEGMRAWLGPPQQEGRWVKLDQTVKQEGVEEGTLTIDKMRRKGPGLVELRMKPGRSVRDIPASGVLQAVENRGARKQEERQREALDVLRAGRAACSRLLDILNAPSLTREPAAVRLPKPVQDQLDEHQQAALLKILGCQELVAIQGPPGAGKTRVIVEALQQLAATRRRSQPPIRVLISSVQNEAIDNVVEKLESVQGLVVRTVRKGGQNEDEDFAQAERRAWGRERIIDALQTRLKSDPIVRKLQSLDDVRSEMARFRLLMLAGEVAFGKVAEALEHLAGNEAAPLTPSSREEARSLARALRAWAPPAGPEGEPEAPPQLPEHAGDVQAWWERVRTSWPIASRAHVDAAVAAVLEATEGMRVSPLRWSRRVEERWKELRTLVEAGHRPAQPSLLSAPSDGDVLRQRLAAWAKRAEEDVRHCADGLVRTPAAVAFRFMTQLSNDPAAWETIKQRHGNTTAATCSMAAKARVPDEPEYDWVIIDEAGRASPFELLVPMVQGRRVVLIGDHRQLPPMVEDEIIDALESDRPPSVDIQRETLFGLLYGLIPAGCRIRLRTQYRMHGAIGALVDRLFYTPHQEAIDSYYSGPVLAAKRAPFWGVLADRPVVWLDLPRNKEAVYTNPTELQAVLDLLVQYSHSQAADKSAPFVGVICAYLAQKEALDHALKTRPELRAIATVRTIDSVQGREYPVVLFCTTRMDGKPGFLAAPSRINVALSRAQRQLIILGSTGAMSSGLVRKGAPHLAQLVSHCQEENLIEPWKEALA